FRSTKKKHAYFAPGTARWLIPRRGGPHDGGGVPRGGRLGRGARPNRGPPVGPPRPRGRALSKGQAEQLPGPLQGPHYGRAYAAPHNWRSSVYSPTAAGDEAAQAQEGIK